jgi:hypothetical protein
MLNMFILWNKAFVRIDISCTCECYSFYKSTISIWRIHEWSTEVRDKGYGV